LSSEKKKSKNAAETGAGSVNSRAEAERPPEDAAEGATETTPESAAPEKAPEAGSATDPLKECEEKLAGLNDRYLRLAAEYDNYRKRTKSELESVYSEAYSSAVLNFLPVFDNLGRALECKDFDGLSAGLNLVMKQISDIYKKLGIEEIPAEGEEFDPRVHNAVLHTEDESLGVNTVAEVLQKGYTLNGRVIRHAMVKVAN